MDMADTPQQGSEHIAAAAALTASAREWHKLQVAALAFVGLCGVLTGDNGTRLPMWLQTAAGVRRLRAGVSLTCVAVGLTALSGSSNWWPQSDADRPVQVSTSGGIVCGPVVDSAAGWIELGVAGTRVRVNLADLVSLRTTKSC